MNDTCNQDCECDDAGCSGGKCGTEATEFTANTHELNNIGKVIGVVSGKGGVGKSLVTSLLAVAMNRHGFRTAVLDADITGPSIPRIFGIRDKAAANELGMLPLKSPAGISIMSVNLLLEDETEPVIWRGPLIGNMVKQFWTDTIWGDIDFMFVDMPPGTGDVPLTVFQSLPVNGIVVVTSPQDLVSMVVAKAVNMAKKMRVPLIGMVENMSYFKCPDNQKEYRIFGESHIDDIAAGYGVSALAKLPIDPAFAAACDKGEIESLPGDWLAPLAEAIKKAGNTAK